MGLETRPMSSVAGGRSHRSQDGPWLAEGTVPPRGSVRPTAQTTQPAAPARESLYCVSRRRPLRAVSRRRAGPAARASSMQPKGESATGVTPAPTRFLRSWQLQPLLLPPSRCGAGPPSLRAESHARGKMEAPKFPSGPPTAPHCSSVRGVSPPLGGGLRGSAPPAQPTPPAPEEVGDVLECDVGLGPPGGLLAVRQGRGAAGALGRS